MKNVSLRALTAAAVLPAAVALAIGAGPASAASHHSPKPPAPSTSASPKPTPKPTPAPAPAPAPAVVVLPATATTTYLGSNFSAGGYARTTYTVKVTQAGTYAAQYLTDGGVAVNTYVDGDFNSQISVGTGVPNPGRSGQFVLSAGVHTIGTSSPDGYGNVAISVVGPQ